MPALKGRPDVGVQYGDLQIDATTGNQARPIIGRIIVEIPCCCQRAIKLKEVFKTSQESAPNDMLRDRMSTESDPLRHTIHGECRTCQRKKKDVKLISSCELFRDPASIHPARQSRLEGEIA